jgi:hypothetical protein
VYNHSRTSISLIIVFRNVDFHTQFSQTIPILCFLYKCNSDIKNKGSFLQIKHSLKYSTFSGKSQEKSKKNLGFLEIYGASILSIFSKLLPLDFAQPALDHALNLSISFSSFSINSCSLL